MQEYDLQTRKQQEARRKRIKKRSYDSSGSSRRHYPHGDETPHGFQRSSDHSEYAYQWVNSDSQDSPQSSQELSDDDESLDPDQKIQFRVTEKVVELLSE